MAELIREIMDAEPATVRPDTPVEDVVRLLRDRGLPGLPVVDESGACVGIVTEADLVLPDDEGDLHIPHYVNLFGGTVFLEPLGHFEQRPDPDSVGPDSTVRDAARLIHKSGHNRLPVVEEGRLVGVVTRMDVLGALAA